MQLYVRYTFLPTRTYKIRGRILSMGFITKISTANYHRKHAYFNNIPNVFFNNFIIKIFFVLFTYVFYILLQQKQCPTYVLTNIMLLTRLQQTKYIKASHLGIPSFVKMYTQQQLFNPHLPLQVTQNYRNGRIILRILRYWLSRSMVIPQIIKFSV